MQLGCGRFERAGSSVNRGGSKQPTRPWIAGEVFAYIYYFKPNVHKDTVRERPFDGFSTIVAFDPTNPQLEVTRVAFETTVLKGLL